MSGAWDWSRYAVGGATRPDSFSGMKPEFNTALQQLFMNAPPELKLQVGSGFRSIERQRQLWEASDKSGKMVARPGGSRHNHGDAADLSAAGARLDKASPAARQWVHENASRYGLAFPMSYEPWHIELAGARSGHAAHTPASPAVAPSSLAAAMSPTPMGEQQPALGPRPSAFGDLIAPRVVETTTVAPQQVFGDLIAQQAQGRQDRQTKQAELEAADKQRKAALFGGSLFGPYA